MKQYLRIGLTGAHSTGKTSVLNKLQVLQPEFNYITEVARNFDIRACGKNRTAVQIKILRAQVQAENEHFHHGFISDRTVIDNLAYFMGIEKRFRSNAITEIYANIVETRLIQMGAYDLIFYFPIEFPIVKDGFRFEDGAFQKTIDNNILLIMRKHNIAHHTVTGDVYERVRYILDTIKANV